jgi:hypothetical protein
MFPLAGIHATAKVAFGPQPLVGRAPTTECAGGISVVKLELPDKELGLPLPLTRQW